MTPTCTGGDVTASACSTYDVVAGLAQVSDQLHNASAFFFYAALFFGLLSVLAVVLLFANGRGR